MSLRKIFTRVFAGLLLVCTIRAGVIIAMLALGIGVEAIIKPAEAKGFVSDPETATRVLIDAGYKPIEVGGFSWLSGCFGSWYQTKFTAISPSGTLVSGTVCTGILTKGAQILINTR